jgi:hypothetical protein
MDISIKTAQIVIRWHRPMHHKAIGLIGTNKGILHGIFHKNIENTSIM